MNQFLFCCSDVYCRLKPDNVVLTNKRFILYHPGLLGCKFDDFLWRDLISVKLNEGLMEPSWSLRQRVRISPLINFQIWSTQGLLNGTRKKSKKQRKQDDSVRCKKTPPKRTYSNRKQQRRNNCNSRRSDGKADQVKEHVWCRTYHSRGIR